MEREDYSRWRVGDSVKCTKGVSPSQAKSHVGANLAIEGELYTIKQIRYREFFNAIPIIKLEGLSDYWLEADRFSLYIPNILTSYHVAISPNFIDGYKTLDSLLDGFRGRPYTPALYQDIASAVKQWLGTKREIHCYRMKDDINSLHIWIGEWEDSDNKILLV